MKLYFVSGPGLSFIDNLRIVQEETGINPFPIRVLLSYLDVRKRSLESYFGNRLKPEELELFLDSGAYGAHQRRIRLDPVEYGNYVKANKDWIHVYANMDVIHNPEGTTVNQDLLEQMGLNPLPVFHSSSPEDVWQKLLEKYDYIALGGVISSAGPNGKGVLSKIARLHKEAQDNGTRIHMFGVGTHRLLSRINFYSSDSSSFIQSRYGKIVVWDERTMTTQKISLRSPELVKYEHFLARYHLPTAPLFMRRPGKFGYAVIRTYEYLEFQRMGEWLTAIWNHRK